MEDLKMDDVNVISIPCFYGYCLEEQNPIHMLVYEKEIGGRKYYYKDPGLTKEIRILPDTPMIYCDPSQIYGYMRMTNNTVIGRPFVKKPFKTDQYTPTPNDYAMYVASVEPLRKYKGVMYYYENGYYSPIDDDRLGHLVLKHFKEDMMKQRSSRYLDEVILSIKPIWECYVQHLPEYPHLIPFSNGILDFNTGIFYPPDPSKFIRWKIDVDFDGRNWNCPVFMTFLNVVTNGNGALRLRLLEIIGYILSGDNNAKKFFLFAGVGNSGKSLLINLINSLYPRECVYCSTMNSLGDKFQGYMSGTQLCTFADMPDEVLSSEAVGNIKALTGGDMMPAWKKYQGYDVLEKTTRLLFATNHPVMLSGSDDAFWDRSCIVPFMVAIPPQHRDPYLYDRLMYERTAIVNNALCAYNNLLLRSNGRVVQFSGEAEAQELYRLFCNSQKLLDSSDSVYRRFISECCAEVAGARVPTQDLYIAYCKFCENNYFRMDPFISFSIRISNYLSNFTKTKASLQGKKLHVYDGLALR